VNVVLLHVNMVVCSLRPRSESVRRTVVGLVRIHSSARVLNRHRQCMNFFLVILACMSSSALAQAPKDGYFDGAAEWEPYKGYKGAPYRQTRQLQAPKDDYFDVAAEWEPYGSTEPYGTAPYKGAPYRQTRQLQGPDYQGGGSSGSGVDNEPIFDFRYDGEILEEKRQEIVGGNISIYGIMPDSRIKDVGDAVLQTIASICSWELEIGTLEEPAQEWFSARVYPELVIQDVNTWGKKIIGVNINYWVLPLLHGNAHCAQSLAFAGIGKDQPPFDVVPAPLFRHLLQWNMAVYAGSKQFDVETWKVTINLPFCRPESLVVRPMAYWKIPERNRTIEDEKECGNWEDTLLGMPSGTVDLDAQRAGFQYESQAGMCKFATTPCMCAAMPSCAWTGGRCKPPTIDGVSQVTCRDCPQQPKCPVNVTALCTDNTIPCSCANSIYWCFWGEDNKCHTQFIDLEGNNQSSSCTACPFQDDCAKPIILSIEPNLRRWLPDALNSIINVTFDRQMQFRLYGLSTRRLLNGVVTFVCRRGPGKYPRIIDIPRERLRWCNQTGSDHNWTFGEEPEEANITGDMLQIETNGTVNEVISTCDLIINEYLAKDLLGVPFAGTDIAEYTFSLIDTAPPRFVVASPPGGSYGIPLDTKFVFYFNEPVILPDDPDADTLASIMRLGREVQNLSDATADEVIAQIDLRRHKVNINGQTVSFELTGIIHNDMRYTISLPQGCFRDSLSNFYQGMPPLVYTFQTIPSVIIYTTPEKSNFLVLILAIFSCVLFGCGCLLFQWYIYCRMKAMEGRYNRRMEDEPGDDIEADEKTEQEPAAEGRRGSKNRVSSVAEEEEAPAKAWDGGFLSAQNMLQLAATEHNPRQPRQPVSATGRDGSKQSMRSPSNASTTPSGRLGSKEHLYAGEAIGGTRSGSKERRSLDNNGTLMSRTESKASNGKDVGVRRGSKERMERQSSKQSSGQPDDGRRPERRGSKESRHVSRGGTTHLPPMNSTTSMMSGKLSRVQPMTDEDQAAEARIASKRSEQRLWKPR